MEEDLRRRVYEKLDMERDIPDEEIMELIESELAAYVRETPLSLAERERLSRELFDSAAGG